MSTVLVSLCVALLVLAALLMVIACRALWLAKAELAAVVVAAAAPKAPAPVPAGAEAPDRARIEAELVQAIQAQMYAAVLMSAPVAGHG